MSTRRILTYLGLPFLLCQCALLDLRSNEQSQKSPARYRTTPGDITLGMGMRDVRSEWGAPERVMTAGQSNQGNQKWIFQDQWGSKRAVYFEKGQVVGWEQIED